MKKKLISILVVGILMVVGVSYGLNKKNEVSTLTPKNTDSIVESVNDEINDEIINVNMNMDLIKSYNSVKSLKDDSEIIVRGSILESKSYISGPGVITEYTFKISKSYNDKIKSGDVIKVAAGGGIVDYQEFSKIKGNTDKNFGKDFPKEKIQKSKVKVRMGKNDLMKTSNEYVIFANTQPISDDKKMYCVLNADQGQFILDVSNNKVINETLNYSNSIDSFEQEILQ